MQVAAIADGVEEAVEEKLGEKVWRVEGKQTGLWVAMDYMDVVVHIFTTELRSFYKLRSCGPTRRSNVMITRSKEIL